MGMDLMMIKVCLAVCALSVHESAAGYAITLEVATSVLLRINGRPPGLRSQAATVQSPKAQQNGSLQEPSNIAPAPSHSSLEPPTRKSVHSPALSPSIPFHKHHHARNKLHGLAPLPSPVSPLYSPVNGPSPSISPSQSPLLPSTSNSSPASAPSPTQSKMSSSLTMSKVPPTSPILTLPPPPPNADCASVTCMEPLTYTPPGLPCGCVRPIQVKLRLSVALYTFFPLVSEFCVEIAEGVLLNQSQVRIVGANAASQQLEKTVVLMNLVPLGQKFNASTAMLTYKKFWHKQVSIPTSLFGDYEVIYVHYPGLPASPPSVPSRFTNDPFSGPGNNGMAIKPLGVDVPKRQNGGLSRSTIAIIVVSSVAVFVICMGAAMLLVLKCGGYVHAHNQNPHALISSLAKPSGAGHVMLGSGPSSPSMSFASSILTYTGPTKTFTIVDIERATNNFDALRILGEGGFGLVYSGILDNGRLVAVKVLKRDDQQGGREFLAEVEMLSRLHHRNLVKLIGICTDDHARCLVYELIPNGSVESHLHGVDEETAPLDWGTRMKIALGAARGLAYLHEDSSPRVIHRDFKSSNILLENDFTPKVSDFGLARTALDEGNKHISTHVMGTFGYLAPEYAMTGHLLVKSDVYSYGVVLLELLTGRKPVDLLQPPGQENLVTWARPLLTSKDGLETIIDPCLDSNFPFDSVAKVAAIASMCVQPEVSHRPFMSEVVQALKLVCNEFDETSEPGIKKCSVDDFFMDVDANINRVDPDRDGIPDTHFGIRGGDSSFEAKIALSNSDLLNSSTGFEGQEEFGSFRRHSSSGPLTPGKRRQFWQRLRGMSRGSVSEHGFAIKLWRGSR